MIEKKCQGSKKVKEVGLRTQGMLRLFTHKEMKRLNRSKSTGLNIGSH